MPSQSKSQQRFFGVVKAMQKGDIPKKGKAGKAAKTMDKDDVDDFASTKHKGLPKKVKKEMKVRELIRKLVRELIDEGTCGYGINGELGEEPAGPHLIKKKKIKEDYKNSEWEVYLRDEKGREKIVKKAKSKRAATILYNRIIKSDDYYEVGMRAIKEGKLTEAKETIFDVAAKVMKDKQAYGYKTKKGLVTVDVQTANLLTKVFKKVNPKMKKILSDLGYKSPTQLMNTLWAVVK